MTMTLTPAQLRGIFTDSLADMAKWLDKVEGDEASLVEAKLAPDMRPLAAQYQMASDSAKGAIARLSGATPPAMPDTEASFAELRDRVAKTIAFIDGVDDAALDGAATKPIELRFPNGMGYAFDGAAFLTGFAIPNFFFHATTAYAILRNAGVPLGKPDFLQHLGPPNLAAM